MNHHIQSGGMTALLAALLTAQWFSSSTEGFLDACGNAVWLPVLVGGLALAGLTALLQRLAPEEGLLNLGRPAALCVALLMTLVGATALRDTLTMLATFLLQQSPRWYTLLLLLPVLILTGCLGMCSVARPLRLIAPALAIGYAAVLLLSVWSQADVYHFFPLLDTGLPKLASTAVSALAAGVWLPLLWIDKPRLGRTSGAGAVLLATVLAASGYAAYALLFPDGLVVDHAFPLHRLSAAGGFSQAFQRVHAPFAFVWLPVQMAAMSAALSTAGRGLKAALPGVKEKALLPVPLLLMLALGYWDEEHSPMGLQILLQAQTQALLLLPLIAGMAVSRIRALHRGKEARHA